MRKEIKNFLLLYLLFNKNIIASSLEQNDRTQQRADIAIQVANNIDEEIEDINFLNWVYKLDREYAQRNHLLISNRAEDFFKKLMRHASYGAISLVKWEINNFYDTYSHSFLDYEEQLPNEYLEQAKKSLMQMIDLAENGKLERLMSLISYVVPYEKIEVSNGISIEIRKPRDIEDSRLQFLKHERIINNFMTGLIDLNKDEDFRNILIEVDKEFYKNPFDDLKRYIEDSKELLNENNFVGANRKVIGLMNNKYTKDLKNRNLDKERFYSGKEEFYVLPYSKDKDVLGCTRRAIIAWKRDIELLLNTYDPKYKPQIFQLFNYVEEALNAE